MVKHLFGVIACCWALVASPASTWTAVSGSSQSVILTCTAATETLPQPSGAWVQTTTYAAGNSITYHGIPYVALQSANTGHEPPLHRQSSTWWAEVGMDLRSVGSIDVHVCAYGAGTWSDAIGFDLWYFDPALGQWSYDQTLSSTATGKTCLYVRGDSPGKGIPMIAASTLLRVAVVPNAVQASPAIDADHPITILLRAVGTDRSLM